MSCAFQNISNKLKSYCVMIKEQNTIGASKVKVSGCSKYVGCFKISEYGTVISLLDKLISSCSMLI